MAGGIATPGFESPFVDNGIGGLGLKTGAFNRGSAMNNAWQQSLLRPEGTAAGAYTGGVQTGPNVQYGMGGGRGGYGGGRGRGSYGSGDFESGGTFRAADGTRMAMSPRGPVPVPSGRINARAQLSPNTGRGLADQYANQVLPGQFDRLQSMKDWQQNWLQPPAGTGSLKSASLLNENFGNLEALQKRTQWRAKGGPVVMQPYIVNEEGPEAYQPKGGKPQLIPGPQQVFLPPKDGKIIPHKKTMRMVSEGKISAPQHRQFGGDVVGQDKISINGIGPNNPYPANSIHAMAGPRFGMRPTIPFITGQWGNGPEEFRNANSAPSRMIPSLDGFEEPIARRNGGPVDAFSGSPEMQWYMSKAQQVAPSTETYNGLVGQAKALGLNMTNAPKTLRGLKRFVEMGQNSAEGVRDGRAAAMYSLQNQPKEVAQPPARPLGKGESASVYFGPRTQPGTFANDSGEMFPMTSPDPWQTTWPQANILDRRAVRIPGRGYTFDDILEQINQ